MTGGPLVARGKVMVGTTGPSIFGWWDSKAPRHQLGSLCLPLVQ